MKNSIQKLSASVLEYIARHHAVVSENIQKHLPNAHESPPSTANRAEQLKNIHNTILSCQECQLCSKRKQAVPGSGACDARVFVVGEAPGAEEDTRGLPFVGASGAYLDKWLAAISLQRNKDVFISNVVKCRPPGNRNPMQNEINSCVGYLHEQITLVQPKTILALGRVAAHTLLDTSDSIRNLRQSTHYYKNIPLVVSYHPSAVLRDARLRKLVWEDLQKLEQLLR